MKKIIFSLLLNNLSLPVLGESRILPTNWLYGESRETLDNISKPSNGASLSVEFREEASINSDRIYLSDIAGCIGEKAACKEVLSVELASSPRPGIEQRYVSSKARTILEKEFPAFNLTLKGSDTVLIRAIGVPVDWQSVRSALEWEWGRLNKEQIRFEIQSLKGPKYLKLRNASYTYKFPDLFEVWDRLKQTPRRSQVTLQVEAVSDSEIGRETFVFPVQLEIKALTYAAIAGRNLERGSVISSGDVNWAWVPYRERLVSNPEELSQKSVRTAIQLGNPLRSFDLIRDPDIRRGERVDALVSKGGIKMAGSGVALESGIVGQKIRVQLDTTKRQMFGRIVAKSQIEVELP
jgi:flagella basal body P-ring formation protein FlgA